MTLRDLKAFRAAMEEGKPNPVGHIEHNTYPTEVPLPEHLKNIHIIYPAGQCGMNFISGLSYAETLDDQVRILDYAFTHWGKNSTEHRWVKKERSDFKSQVFFTDVVSQEQTRWGEIKKLCYKGPVTRNRRYVNQPDRLIRMYILTWEDYKKWREAKYKKEEGIVARLMKNVKILKK